MKKDKKKLVLILRDKLDNAHPVTIYEGAHVDIDIYRGNMVMNHPRVYDTNKKDYQKKYCYDGGMDFIATPELVAKFNSFTDSYDCQNVIHEDYMRQFREETEKGLEDGTIGVINIL